MARGLRHEDPRCGREHFDARAGVEWEWGPNPTDITYSIPDVPWNRYRRTLEPNQLLFDNGQWAVTVFGLEFLSHLQERYERYAIPADDLLIRYNRLPVYMWPVKVANESWIEFDAFEEAFRKAVEVHFPPRKLPPKTLDEFILEQLGYRQPSYEPSPWVDSKVLDTTFRRARAIARKRAG
jgi:hypothetical protein